VAIEEGAAGEKQFSDVAARDPTIMDLRDRIVATVDPNVPPDAAGIDITLRDGRHLRLYVPHAIGSIERPMTDADLEKKFAGLVEGILPPGRTRRLIDLCWNLEALTDVAEVARVAC